MAYQRTAGGGRKRVQRAGGRRRAAGRRVLPDLDVVAPAFRRERSAELFCAELARLSDGIDVREEAARSYPRPATAFFSDEGSAARNRRWTTRRASRKPACTLARRSEAPAGQSELPDPDVRGHLTRRRFATRAEQLGGGLFPITFFVACVARAHDRVFRHRGQCPAGYGISVPTQTRKRGAKGPLFHNHVAPLFFNPRREHLGSVAETAAAMKAQFAVMVRTKVADSFDIVLDLMHPLPSRLFMGSSARSLKVNSAPAIVRTPVCSHQR